MPRLCTILAIATLAGGCSEPPPVPPVHAGSGGAGPETGCPAGSRQLEDGRCLGAGEPESGCAAGELVDTEGACVPAGLGPDDCGGGFEHDGSSGCVAILPEAPCESGTWAVPGDGACRDFATCGSEKWPTISEAPAVLYVDVLAADPQDGSADRPFASIQQAVDAAPNGAAIAVAEGTYHESISVVDKPVSIWGRCASLVRVEPTGAAAFSFGSGAAGSELHGVELTGNGHGVVVSDAEDVELSDLWIHDLSGHGAHLERAASATSATVSRSLIERVTGRGAYALAGHLTLEDVVIRELLESSDRMGRCVDTDQHPETNEPSEIVARRLVVERCVEIGIMVHASSATVEESLIRDTQPTSDGHFGRGVHVQTNVDGQPGQLTLVASNVEGARDSGVSFMAAEGTLDRVVIRDVRPNVHQSIRGYGLGATALRYAPTHVLVRRSLIENASEAGVFDVGASVELESVLVRNTQPVSFPSPEGTVVLAGRGLVVQNDDALEVVGVATARGCVLRRNHEVGVSVAGGSLSLEDSVVDETQPVGIGIGRGIAIQPCPLLATPAHAEIRSSLVSNNQEVGIAVSGSDVVLEGVRVEGTAPMDDGRLGIGVYAEGSRQTGGRAFVEIRDSVSSHDHTAGIMASGADVSLIHSLVEQTLPGAPTLPFGDGVVALAVFEPPTISIRASVIRNASRAGIANFGGAVDIESTSIDCASMSLVADRYGGSDPVTVDLEGNQCGCGDDVAVCMVRTTSLEPPDPPSEL